MYISKIPISPERSPPLVPTVLPLFGAISEEHHFNLVESIHRIILVWSVVIFGNYNHELQGPAIEGVRYNLSFFYQL